MSKSNQVLTYSTINSFHKCCAVSEIGGLSAHTSDYDDDYEDDYVASLLKSDPRVNLVATLNHKQVEEAKTLVALGFKPVGGKFKSPSTGNTIQIYVYLGTAIKPAKKKAKKAARKTIKAVHKAAKATRKAAKRFKTRVAKRG